MVSKFANGTERVKKKKNFKVLLASFHSITQGISSELYIMYLPLLLLTHQIMWQ